MKYLLIILFVLLIQTASGIRINEVELNPAGSDTGNEWIELYNSGEISLDSYKLVNNDGDEINLSGSFKGYYIYTFTKQWLDNSDEKIFLYKGEELIDETDLLEDSKNNDDTWDYCTSWKFGKSTKEEKNDCVENNGSDDKNEKIMINETKNNKINDESEKFEAQVSEVKIINLNPKTIKTEENNDNSSKSNYAIWGFVFFCVLLSVLFILKIRKNKYNKNEFKE